MKWYLLLIVGLMSLLLHQPNGGSLESAESLAAGGSGNWSPPLRISTTSSQAVVPTIRTAPNGVIMVMYNHSDPNSNNKDPYYSLSTTQGQSWSSPAAVHSGSDNSVQVDFSFDGQSKAHAVWVNESLNTIRYAHQDNWPSGATIIAESGGPAQQLSNPRVAAHGNGIVDIVWSASNPLDIFHSRSIDGGENWTTPTAIASADAGPQRPAVTVDSAGNIHVVWEESLFIDGDIIYRIHYSKGTSSPSNPANVSWPATPTVISNMSTDGNARRPAIAFADNIIHVSFTYYVTRDEQYAYYTRLAAGSWSMPVDTTHGQWLTVNITDPFNLATTLAVCNNDIHVYYHGTTHSDGKEQIWGAHAPVSGATIADNWTARERVTNTDQTGNGEPDTRTLEPTLICQSGSLHISFLNIDAQSRQVYYTQRLEVIYLPIIHRN